MAKAATGSACSGTTGEGPSLTVDERMAGLEAVLAAGIPAAQVLPGTGCAALPDTVRLTRHAIDHGCCNVLVMPPFFFKDVSDSGVVDLYSRIIEGVGSSDLRIYIYNFPAMTAASGSARTPSPGCIEAYPSTIAGVKDSSGDWDYVTALLKRFPGTAVFTGWETLLPPSAGGRRIGEHLGPGQRDPGSAPPALRPDGRNPPKTNCWPGVSGLVDEVVKYPSIPAIKALAANLREWPAWRNMRPPLAELDAGSERRLVQAFEKTLQETEAVVLSGC